MADERGRREPSAGSDPGEGVRPSPRARERFAADLRSDVEATRAAWYDASLRGRERLLAGDDHGAMEALEDQRRLLRLLEDRLERAVASAVVEREAEGVLAGSEASVLTEPAAAGGEVTPPRLVGAEESVAAGPGAHPLAEQPGGRLRALVAAGAAAAVAALAVGLGALVGPVTPPSPEVAGPVDGTADEAAPQGTDAAAGQDVGTAGQASPLPVAPPTSTWLPRDWWDLWSVEPDAAGDHAAEGAQGDEAPPEAPGQHDDTVATDAPSPSGEDRTTPEDATADGDDATRDGDDAARDEADTDPDADEPSPEERDRLLDLRPLFEREDGPGDGAGEREGSSEESADLTTRLDSQP